ncbi:uncharacterized protein LOC129778565 [Toxorhynchites rutilus septentrionalis]|uniref:uncharacterized protein LOC129778565 n=1 Tax=Toxorhynchites rutilus septentrionalis TaxID=329112 RepID=UPI0024786F3E|nr:uncharacterized protein LOC129778565 [Toxorhynchites rutilus septentrionalis]
MVYECMVSRIIHYLTKSSLPGSSEVMTNASPPISSAVDITEGHSTSVLTARITLRNAIVFNTTKKILNLSNMCDSNPLVKIEYDDESMASHSSENSDRSTPSAGSSSSGMDASSSHEGEHSGVFHANSLPSIPDNLPESYVVDPTLVTDWDTFHIAQEYTEQYGEVARLLRKKFVHLREEFIRTRLAELPPIQMEPNRIKARGARVYSAEEAAKREKNNACSRNSRIKRKVTQRMLNVRLEYYRYADAIVDELQEDVDKVIQDKVENMLQNNVSEEKVWKLLQICGLKNDE